MMTPLEQRRRAAGLTQAQLAAKAGLHQTYISDLETGRLRRPNLDAALDLAAALECDPRELFPRATDAPTPTDPTAAPVAA